MTIKSKQLFIIIGDDKTGKTTLQKLLIYRICGIEYATLQVNKLLDISHPEIKRKYKDIFFGNRSYQEKVKDYISVDNYFQIFFQPADIAIISSHLVEADILRMIHNGRKLFYNVNGVFCTNSIANNISANSQISLLDWNERFVLSNPIMDDAGMIHKQLELVADNFVELLINRTNIS
jgi:hypothetical protein